MMNSSNPKSFASSVRLPVVISGSRVLLADGSPLPKLHDHSPAELVLDASSIVEDAVRERLTREDAHEVLPAGTQLWARVKLDNIDERLRAHRVSKREWGVAHDYVMFVTVDGVRLVASEGNLPVLDYCRCRIPALPDLQPASINEAYTRISEVFEPSRRSHTGNVFSCVFVERNGLLKALRCWRNDTRPKNRQLPLQMK